MFGKITELALAELAEKSKNRLYQRDFIAWQYDVLGQRTYAKMREISHEALLGPKDRTVIKSGNGVGKSLAVAGMICWAASVFPPGDSLVVTSAPSLDQLQKVVFRYLKDNYNYAAKHDHPLPGWINEALGWQYRTPGGNIDLVFGRKPPDQDAVSAFQGTRSKAGKTFVFFDEAGGMSKQMYTAAEAVMTGKDARFVGIGNPDSANSEFREFFDLEKYEALYNRYTISVFDLPTFTGEVVYPDEPEKEQRMLSALTQQDWVENKKQIWGEKDARYKSKVLGEFSDAGTDAFFGQEAMNKAWNTEIPSDGTKPLILGVDVARYGQDETVVAVNRGGRVRIGPLDDLPDSEHAQNERNLEMKKYVWGKSNLVTTARKVHKLATELGATEVRIDSSGVGAGVFDQLEDEEQFPNRKYELYAIDGGSKSPDITRWARLRDYNHDYLRTQMINGEIDLDGADTDLKEQLTNVTFAFTNRGGIQITPKDKMKTQMGGSPDHLDAVIYATTDISWFTGNDINQLAPGTVVFVDPETMYEWDLTADGMPM